MHRIFLHMTGMFFILLPIKPKKIANIKWMPTVRMSVLSKWVKKNQNLRTH